MLITEDILKNFREENNADFASITNYFGEVIAAVNIDNQDSYAAMSAAILSMCDKYLEDLDRQATSQLILKTSDGIIVFSKISVDNVVIVGAKSGVNLGMFLHQSELFAKKLN